MNEAIRVHHRLLFFDLVPAEVFVWPYGHAVAVVDLEGARPFVDSMRGVFPQVADPIGARPFLANLRGFPI